MNTQSFWQATATLAAFWLVLAGCQPEDPYQDTANLPVAADTQEATAQSHEGSDGVPGGAGGALPLDQRAAGSEQAWNDATDADYQTAMADCQNLTGVTREDCIEQVEIGFRAARAEAQNPAEAVRIIEDAELDAPQTADTDSEEIDAGDE